MGHWDACTTLAEGIGTALIPGNGDLHLRWPEVVTAPVHTQLVDALGKAVVNQTLSSTDFTDREATLLLPDLAPGVYTLIATSGNQRFYRKIQRW